MKQKKKNEIKILQWNARGLNANGPALLHYLETNRLIPDVICIQESFLKEPKTFNIDGYEIIRKDRSETPGGGTHMVY